MSDSLRGILGGPNHPGGCETCATPCGAACDECGSPPCEDGPECSPPCEHRRWHLPKCRFYDPEAGIFNFCIPPQCINEPPPLPPGRFFPVPVRPAFAPRQLSTDAPPYAM